MCGIAGMLINRNISTEQNLLTLKSMTHALKHRGPDNEQTYIDEYIGLGHTRLSILDLSINASQPMESFSKRYVISFNGEIYNHLELRNELFKTSKFNNWGSYSDTSTLVNLFDYWDINKILIKLKGMFAFALWDKKNKSLFLARDRFGEKPLYYGLVNNQFMFASELKSLKQIANFKNKISQNSAKIFSKLHYVPCPYSIYEDIYKLEPATYLNIQIEKKINLQIEKKIDLNNSFIKKKRWWKSETISQEQLLYKNLSYSDRLSKLNYNLDKSVKSQLISDVSLGAFLSGGIDSSLIAFYMQKNSSKKIDTFSIGMNNPYYDESKKAKNIAEYLGTNHNEYILNTNDIKNCLPIMHNIYDEPFADSSQIPTYLLSKFASKKVKVALTGDGGDELFGGYVRHIWSNKILRLINYFPLKLRKKLGKLLLNLNFNSVIRIEKFINLFLANKSKLVQLDKKFNKLGKILSSSSNIYDFYFTLISVWPNMGNVDHSKFIIGKEGKACVNDFMWLDIDNYLHDDVLCKVDRAAMSNSLETRVPFLDKDVFDISQSFSFEEKTNKTIGKIPLRDLMKKNFPTNSVDQPKMGFGIPLNDWMRNDLKFWVDDILNSDFVKTQEFFDRKTLLYYWKEHSIKGKNYGEYLWNSLIFLNWLKDNHGSN